MKKIKTLNETDVPEQVGGIYFLISRRSNIIKYNWHVQNGMFMREY